jgi:Zn-dependent protease with chaperone function
VAITLVVLQAIYLAMVILAACATVGYVYLIPGILVALNLNAISLLAALTPLVTGVFVTFFLFKPLLAKPPAAQELLSLERASEPVLFAFVDRICLQLGAPAPTRIDIDLRANASASLRLGWRSLFSSDMVLTLGLPLAAGMNVQQFAGVIAHEFGHFSQRVGLRLYFLIGTIRRWFIRVAYDRDKWDSSLEETRKKAGWRAKAILTVAWAAIGASRGILRALLWCANIVSAWFSRQMEFDADRHAAALAGADAFREALELLPILDSATQSSWEMVNRSWRSGRLCEDFPSLVRHRASTFPEDDRKNLLDYDSDEKADRWATHPSRRERIESIHGIRGVAGASRTAAEVLFADFGALCRRATLHVYHLSLGDAAVDSNLLAANRFIEETAMETRRAEAVQVIFANVSSPARWFQLRETPPGEPIRVYLYDEDPSTRYWSLLEDSLNQFSGVEFLRAGGKIRAASFSLNNEYLEAAEIEESRTREALTGEIESLRERFATHSAFFTKAQPQWLAAFRALSSGQEQFLELRYQLIALRVIRGNLQFLPEANAASALEEHRRRVQNCCTALTKRFDGVPCPPLSSTDVRHTLKEYLLLDRSQELEPEVLAARILEQNDWIGAALLGEICSQSQ